MDKRILMFQRNVNIIVKPFIIAKIDQSESWRFGPSFVQKTANKDYKLVGRL